MALKSFNRASPSRKSAAKPLSPANYGPIEQDWQEVLDRVERYATEHALQRKLELTIKLREGEVKQLQQALSDSHALLHEERDRQLQTQSQNEELWFSAQQSHQALESLRSRCRRSRCRQCLGGISSPRSRSNSPERGDESPRKVMIPAATAQSLVAQVESLQAQLAQQRQLSDERVTALLEDRRIRTEEDAAHAAAAAAYMQDLMQRLQQAEHALHQTTKDYILAKRETQVAVNAAKESAQASLEKHVAAAKEATEGRKRAHEALELAKREAKAQAAELRERLHHASAEYSELAQAHEEMRDAYVERLQEVEEQLGRACKQARDLETRRALDMEGWASDVTLLRKQLAATDRKMHQMRLVGRLPDDERLDAMLDTLSQKAPDVEWDGDGDLHNDGDACGRSKTFVSGPLAEVMRAENGIQSLERRLRRTNMRR